MIKFENTQVWGFQHAIRGMRNPLNSWEKSDSYFNYAGENVIGKNDLELMRKLYKAGTEHRKYLRQIMVSVDITAPMYWFSEYDTYKVGTVANSCSKMHKLLAKPFEMDDFSFDRIPGYKRDVRQFRPDPEDFDFEEEWKESVGGYSVSNYGRVKNPSGRILSCSVHKDGYIFVTIKSKQIPAHRLVAEAFCERKEGCDVVNHIDGNKMNNSAPNIEWCTQSDNIKHSIANNLQPRGLSTYKGKFTADQRAEIKRLWDSGEMSMRKIAQKYGVSHSCISGIIKDKYAYEEKTNEYENFARPLVDRLNELRDLYLVCEDPAEKKEIWYTILQMLPESYMQKRTVTMNYENVVTMLRQREGHKLDEWNAFVRWGRTLPYIEDITHE